MSNVTSLKVSKTLYEVSGWEDTAMVWSKRLAARSGNLVNVERGMVERRTDQFTWKVVRRDLRQHTTVPAYDLGYLLRKLPNYIEYWNGGNEAGYLQLIHFSSHWSAGYEDVGESGQSIMQHLNETPEDAAAKLAIELFRNGVLKREDS